MRDSIARDSSARPSIPAPAPGAARTIQVVRAQAGELGWSELAVLLRAHQREHWRDGAPVFVETYLQELPDLRTDEQELLDLITSEIALREERGESPSRAEYFQRFPQHAEQLRRRFALLDLLTAASAVQARPAPRGLPSIAAEEPTTLPPQLQALDGSTVKPLAVPPLSGRASVSGYEILGELGRGGMGVVYKARQVSLNRVVAIKMILAGAHACAEDLARLRGEAEAIARLQHPNIVQIFEIEEQDGRPYFSMEYADGGSLAQQLEGMPQPARAAASFLETLARAMEAAHQRGIVHRDLKPANVLLVSIRSQGPEVIPPHCLDVSGWVPKITDFGLAKRMAKGEGDYKTEAGAILGTPSYMAPEQAGGKGAEIGPAVDVYALGAILYELLTGRPPFRSPNPLDTLLEVVTEDPLPPSRLQPRVPRDLETICLKCLQKNPRKRYASALALAEELRRFLENKPILARPVPFWERGAKWARRRPAAAIILGLVCLVPVLGFAEFGRRFQQTAQRGARTAADLEQVEQELYFSQIGLAQHEWQSNHPDQAVALLDRCSEDRRGWEWSYLERQCRRSSRVLPGGGGAGLALPVAGNSLAVSRPDARSLLLSDLQSGHRTQTFEHVGPGFAYSADGKWLAAALWPTTRAEEARPATVKVWGAATGREVAVLEGPAGLIWGLALSPDGRRLAAGGADGTTVVWELPSGRRLARLRGPTALVDHLAFGPEGRFLAAGAQDDTVWVWDVATGEASLTIPVESSRKEEDRASFPPDLSLHAWQHPDQGKPAKAPMPAPHPVAISPDGRLLALGNGHAVALWDLPARHKHSTLYGHAGIVRCLAFRADGQQLLSAGADRTIRIWNVSRGRELAMLHGHPDAVNGVAFRGDGDSVVSISQDRTLVWDGIRSDAAVYMPWRSAYLGGVAFAPDPRRIAVGNPDGSVTMWDTGSGRQIQTLRGHGGAVPYVAFSAGGQRLASAGSDGTVRVWAADDIHEIATLVGPAEGIARLALSVDGRTLAAAGLDQTLRIWDIESGQPLAAQQEPLGRIVSLALRPGGQAIAFGRDDGQVQFWDPQATPPLSVLGQHAAEVTALAFSPDGASLASASRDGGLKFWDAVSWQALPSPSAGAGSILSMVFSPDGRRLVTGGGDGAITLWHPTTGRKIVDLAGPPAPILALAFAADGGRLAAAGRDGGVYVWDIRAPAEKPVQPDPP